MGFHGSCNFQKRRNLYMSKHRVNKLKRKNRAQLRNQPFGQIDKLDAQLMSIQQLKKRRSNPTANIALSAKKRNKLLKRLRHSMRAKQDEPGDEDAEADFFESDDEEEVPEDSDSEEAKSGVDGRFEEAPSAMEVAEST